MTYEVLEQINAMADDIFAEGIEAERAAPGLADAVTISLRDVVADALAFDCAVVVMAHNHPSGDPTPSDADYSFTRALARTLAALGAPLYDHLVLVRGGAESFRARGLL